MVVYWGGQTLAVPAVSQILVIVLFIHKGCPVQQKVVQMGP